MVKIKICGLTRKEDIEAVNLYRPDYIGFVFAPSKRYISPENAGVLKRMLSPSIKAVGVYVNALQEEILAAADAGIIDMIQLHGEEDEEYIKLLKKSTPLPIIKAVRVAAALNTTACNAAIHDITSADQLPCDYLLLDSYVKGIQGGSGQQFPWSMIPPLKKPYFLAGGLTIENLAEAARTGAYCLDLSSAAETNGLKDPEKIRQIIPFGHPDNACPAGGRTSCDNVSTG